MLVVERFVDGIEERKYAGREYNRVFQLELEAKGDDDSKHVEKVDVVKAESNRDESQQNREKKVCESFVIKNPKEQVRQKAKEEIRREILEYIH